MSHAAAAAKSLQSCPTLCDPIDGNPPGSSVPGILQARTLEWVAISFSNAWKWKVKVKSLSRVQLLATPWTAAYQAPLPMGFSRQEFWSGVPHELTRNQKSCLFEMSCLILCNNNEPFLNWIVTQEKKWVVYNNRWQPAQWLDREEAPKHFPKLNLHQKKVSWSVFGVSCLIHYSFLESRGNHYVWEVCSAIDEMRWKLQRLAVSIG